MAMTMGCGGVWQGSYGGGVYGAGSSTISISGSSFTSNTASVSEWCIAGPASRGRAAGVVCRWGRERGRGWEDAAMRISVRVGGRG